MYGLADQNECDTTINEQYSIDKKLNVTSKAPPYQSINVVIQKGQIIGFGSISSCSVLFTSEIYAHQSYAEKALYLMAWFDY